MVSGVENGSRAGGGLACAAEDVDAGADDAGYWGCWFWGVLIEGIELGMWKAFPVVAVVGGVWVSSLSLSSAGYVRSLRFLGRGLLPSSPL